MYHILRWLGHPLSNYVCTTTFAVIPCPAARQEPTTHITMLGGDLARVHIGLNK